MSRILVAAQIVVYVNGRAYAQVTSFRWNSMTPKKAIYGLDSGEPFELAPTTTKIGGEMGLLRLMGDGGLEGAGVTALFPDLPREKYFTMTLRDMASDTQIFRAENSTCISQAWDVPAKGMVTGRMSFEALDWDNEVHFD